MNDYLQNLLKRRTQPLNNIAIPRFCGSSLKKTIINPNSKLSVATTRHEKELKIATHAKTIDVWKSNVYLFDINEEDEETSISEQQVHEFWNGDNFANYDKKEPPNTCYIFLCFIVKSLIHLIFHGGIIESYINNICYHKKKLIAPFIDLCNLHVLFQSICMMAAVLMFSFNHLYLNDFQKAHNINHSQYLFVILIQSISLFLSFLTSCIFTVNFEKFRYIPLYNAESWQFSKHNMVAIYTLLSGDIILRFIPFVLFYSFWYIVWKNELQQTSDIVSIANNSILFIFCIFCLIVGILLCLIYHILCWYKWGFLPRQCWVYEHKPYLEYQILNPMINILDIDAIFGYLMRQYLFIYGAVIICNISIIGYIYYRPVVTKKNKHPQFVRKLIGYECFIRYCIGMLILSMILIQGQKYKNQMIYIPYSISILLKIDAYLLVLGVVILIFNIILLHNLSDTPLFHIALFNYHDNMRHHHRKVNVMDDDDESSQSDWSDTERSSYLMLPNQGGATPTDDDDDDDDDFIDMDGDKSPSLAQLKYDDSNRSMKTFYDTHKPTKINCFLQFLIKITFSYQNNNNYHKSDIQPWSSYAMIEKWELHSMGYWQRKQKYLLEKQKEREREKQRIKNKYKMKINNNNTNGNTPSFDFDRNSFNEDKIREQAKKDPFYKQHETLNRYNEALRDRTATKFLSNVVHHDWKGHKWRKIYLEQMDELDPWTIYDSEYSDNTQHENEKEIRHNMPYDDNPEININTMTLTASELRTNTESFTTKSNSSLLASGGDVIMDIDDNNNNHNKKRRISVQSESITEIEEDEEEKKYSANHRNGLHLTSSPLNILGFKIGSPNNMEYPYQSIPSTSEPSSQKHSRNKPKITTKTNSRTKTKRKIIQKKDNNNNNGAETERMFQFKDYNNSQQQSSAKSVLSTSIPENEELNDIVM